MTFYALPTPPSGPVWDRHGIKWTPLPTYDDVWENTSRKEVTDWRDLLYHYGPLTSQRTFSSADLPDAPPGVTRVRDHAGDEWILLPYSSRWTSNSTKGELFLHWAQLLLTHGPVQDITST